MTAKQFRIKSAKTILTWEVWLYSALLDLHSEEAAAVLGCTGPSVPPWGATEKGKHGTSPSSVIYLSYSKIISIPQEVLDIGKNAFKCILMHSCLAALNFR